MARSLVVKHEEKLGTSPLLNGFLFLALAWMIGGAVVTSLMDGSAPAPAVAAGK
jgi:hypothetical protein